MILYDLVTSSKEEGYRVTDPILSDITEVDRTIENQRVKEAIASLIIMSIRLKGIVLEIHSVTHP
jgi:hypothetical protein